MSWMYRLIRRGVDSTSLTLDSSVKKTIRGTSASPVAINTADDIGQATYFKSSATSGTTYGRYNKLSASGAGVEAIAGRDKVVLSAAAGNAHGIHTTLEVTSTGYVTGLGTAVRGNIVFGTDTVVPYGTYYGVMGEIYGAGATSSLPATSNACIGCSVTGGGIEDVANVFAFSCTSGTGHAVYSKGSSITGTMTGWIRVLVNGAVQYMPLYAAAPA